MHRVLTIQTGRGIGVPFGFVSKRICCAALFSVALLALLGGFMLGRFAWDREKTLRAAASNPHGVRVPVAIDGAGFIVQETLATNIQQHLKDLNTPSPGNLSQNEYQARLLMKHFRELEFDSLSVKSSVVLMSYLDRTKPNKVSIVDKNTEVYSFNSSESAYFPTPVGVSVTNTIEDIVVYINFGQDSDFLYLKKMGIVVKDRIVLARLGKVSPVNLVDSALKKWARGVVLFADPQQYSHTASPPNPVLWPSQLGLLQYMHGNPSTTKMGTIVNGEDPSTVRCVPVQVISALDAEQILQQMSSNNQSHKSWMGSLKSTTYPMGPGFSTQDYRLRLEINAVNVDKEFFNVIAAIRGIEEPDRYVLLGSDREPLATRNSDPLEGTANMMELARVLNKLQSTSNWRPRRTIVFCSWGATQTEGYFRDAPLNGDWATLLDLRAVSYLNIDMAKPGSSSLTAHGAPLLCKLLYDASALVPYPGFDGAKATVYDVWLQETPNTTNSHYPIVGAVTQDVDLQTLLHNQGVPSLHFQFRQSESTSNSRLQESRQRSRKAAVQLWGILTWTLADNLVLPFDVQEYAAFLVQSITVIETQYERVMTDHELPIAQLRDAVKNFSDIAETFQKKLAHIDKTNTLQMRIMNDQLLQLERAFLHHSPTSKTRHIVLAPGASITDDASVGFGALQDQLDDINTSPIAADLRASTSDHIMSLVHCVKSAISVLEEPLVPLTLSDL